MKKTALILFISLLNSTVWSQQSATLNDIVQIKKEVELQQKQKKAPKPKQYKNSSKMYRFTNFDMENSNLITQFCNAIAVDKKNVVWVGTKKGIARVDSDFVTLVDTFTIDSLSYKKMSVSTIAIDSEDNKWFVINNSILAKFDNTSWTIYNSTNSPIELINNIFTDQVGNVWVCTNNGILKHTNGNWTSIDTQNSLLPNNHVDGGFVDSKNRIWIGTKGGSILINGNDTISFQDSQTYLYNSMITDGLEDEDGNIWFTTTSLEYIGDFLSHNRNGLTKMSVDGTWSHLAIGNSDIPSNYISNFIYDKNRATMWLCGDYYKLIRYQNKEWEVYTVDNSAIYCTSINDMAFDKDGNLWCASTCGLTKINLKKNKK